MEYNRYLVFILRLLLIIFSLFLSLLIVWHISEYLFLKNKDTRIINDVEIKLSGNHRAGLIENQKGKAEKTVNGKTIFKYNYSIDEFGRRVTPVKNEKERNKTILFFADSLMFGYGVNDNETLPFYFADLMPDFMPYNCAVPGASPHEMLEYLVDDSVNNGIKKSKCSVCVYLFIDDHVERVINSHIKNLNTPCYYIDKNDALKNDGTSFWNKAVPAFLIKVLEKSELGFMLVNTCICSRGNEKDIYLVCKMIEKSKQCFKARYGSERFIVLIWPGSLYYSKMIPYFKKAGIAYFDYHDLSRFDETKVYNIPLDGHPSKIAYKDMAELLAKNIREYIKD